MSGRCMCTESSLFTKTSLSAMMLGRAMKISGEEYDAWRCEEFTEEMGAERVPFLTISPCGHRRPGPWARERGRQLFTEPFGVRQSGVQVVPAVS